jgi:hypothetical protein
MIRLQANSDDGELKVVIGEQIGVWIESLKWEAITLGQESKIVLILLLFSKLLLFEVSSAPPGSHSSRLEAHLPLIADSLFKWSEKQSSGLWATLGFGEASVLSPQVRLFCKFTSTFIASRLVEQTDAKKKTFNDRIRAIEADSDFNHWKTFINVDLISFYDDDSKTIAILYELIFIQSKVFFPDQVMNFSE